MTGIEAASLFFAGLLAGEELVIRFGVRGPLAGLDPQAHIVMRQGLIRTLRVYVPIVYGLALVSAIAAALMAVPATTACRVATVVVLLLFMGVTLGGTVPINQAALAWRPSAPPPDWKRLVIRWERLDSVRTVLAVAAFALALAGALER